MALTIFLIIILFLTAIETAIPFLIKSSVVFGVSIPAEYTKDGKLLAYKKKYSILIFCFSMLVLISYLLWAIQGNPSEELVVLVGTSILFAILFISLAAYVYFHAKITQLKRAQKWGEGIKQVKMTDLSVRTQDEMLPWYIYVLPMLVTLGVLAYTILQYQALPEQIPTHWGPNGQPDAFTTKSPISVISLPLILLAMQGMFLGINVSTKRSGIKLSATRTEASRIRQLTLRKYSSWFLFLTSVLITMLLVFLQLTMIHEGLFSEGVMLIIPLVFLLVILTGSIVFAVKVGRAGEDLAVQTTTGIADYDEDQYWKGGLFYFNKNDPSIFVEKRFGVGWTLNFANPKGYLLILSPIVLILILAIFM